MKYLYVYETKEIYRIIDGLDIDVSTRDKIMCALDNANIIAAVSAADIHAVLGNMIDILDEKTT